MSHDGYETRDVSAMGLLAAAVALILCAVAMFGSLHIAYRRLTHGEGRELARVEPPQPRLQRDPAWDFAAFRAEQLKRLDTYRWIDKKAGIAQIPIERAMELLAHGR